MVTYVLGGLSVLATFLAVGLSVATFRISNHRDDTRWRRDAITDAMAQFLDASFQRYSERAWETRLAGKPLSPYHERNDDCRRKQNQALTKLRLFASDDVVLAAEGVLVCDERIEFLLKSKEQGASSSWIEANKDRQKARTTFVTTYRNDFNLGNAVPIRNRQLFE